MTAQEWPRGATLCPRSVAAGRSYPVSEIRGATLSLRPGAAAGRSHPRLRPGPAAGRSNPGAVAAEAQEGLEEISHIEGQEQQW